MAGLIDRETAHSLILTSSSLSVNIDGFMSSILASLTYFNQFDHEVDALFVFDDSKACVTGLQAVVVNQSIHLEIQEPTTLGKNSEGQAVNVQQKTQNGFSISIGRIPPNVNVLLEVTVIGELQTANSEALVFKTAQVFTPFWEQPLDISHQNRVTDPEGRCITEHPYAFDIKIRAGMPCLLAGCFSPSHAIRVDADADATSAETVVITLAEQFECDREIEILFYPSEPLEPYAAIEPGLESRSEEIPWDFLSNGILAVSVMPELPKSSVFREFVFMVDRSGSMNGSHISDAKEGLVLFLKSLPTTALFNVVSFGSYSRTLFQTSQPYNQENLDKGCAYVNSIRADMGGSELLQPLKVVLEKPLRIGYPRNIFLLTDGDISHPETILKYLRMRVNFHNTRIFAFGIGPKISYETVSSIARAGQGRAYFASQQGNIQTKIVQCLKEAQQPLLCNIKVDWQLPDKFKIHHACHEIPFATHGQRLNLFASVTLPSRAQQQHRAGLKDSHSSSNGIKEFWFDEDFESCQLGDSNEFLGDPRFQDELLGDWDSDDDADIRSQCSDYEPLVIESEDHLSGSDRDQVEREEDDRKEYRETKSIVENLGGNYVENNPNDNRIFTKAAIKTSSSEARTETSTDNNYSDSSNAEAKSFACIDSDTDERSRVSRLDKSTLNNMKRNYKEINERNESDRETNERNDRGVISCQDRNANYWKSQENVINMFTYNSGLGSNEHNVYSNNKDTYPEIDIDQETERNSENHPAHCCNALFNDNTMAKRNTSEMGIQGQNNFSTDEQNKTSKDISLVGPIKRGQKDLTPSCLRNTPPCLRNTSQPSLTDLYEAPRTHSHHSTGYEDSRVYQTMLNSRLLVTNHQSSPSSSLPQPEANDRWSKDLSTKYPFTEGNRECNQSLSGCYPCERGYVILSGFLGPNVYTKKIPFCLKSTPSTEYRGGDLHQMAAVSFIQSMERMLGSTQYDDSLERDIIELSKGARVPSRITSQVTVDEQERVIDVRQDPLHSTMIRRRRSSLTTCAYKHYARSTCSEDEPPAILVSCPSVDEEPRAPPKQRYQGMTDTDNLSDEDGSYYRLERLAPEGCDEVKPSSDTTGRHHRKRLVECRNTPVKTIQRRKLVTARLTLLTKRMKNAQKLNVFAGPPFIRLILLQAAQGYWQLTYAFARIVELPLVQLELAAPFADCTMIPLGQQNEQLGIDCYYDSLSLWATAIAIVYLKKKWESHKENWELVAAKAETWLKQQTFPQGFSYADVMLAARQAIVLLEQKYRSRARSEPVVRRT